MGVLAAAPWWAAPTFTLAGVALGSVSTWFIERFRAKDADRTRLDDHAREDSLRWKSHVQAEALNVIEVALEFLDSAYLAARDREFGNLSSEKLWFATTRLSLVATDGLSLYAEDLRRAASAVSGNVCAVDELP